MCLTWDFRLNMLGSSNFLTLYVIYISAIALHISLLWSYVCVRMKQMNCRELYIHLSPVYIQICPTMNNNDQQWITMTSSWETPLFIYFRCTIHCFYTVISLLIYQMPNIKNLKNYLYLIWIYYIYIHNKNLIVLHWCPSRNNYLNQSTSNLVYDVILPKGRTLLILGYVRKLRWPPSNFLICML